MERLSLWKGYPLVEDVVFVKHGNVRFPERDNRGNVIDNGRGISTGNCYWTAVALLIYGDARTWLRVKAEHIAYLETVLGNPEHPEYDRYKRLGAENISSPAQRGRTFNIWEGVQWPDLWVGDDMCHVTADVYGVCLWLYKYDGDTTKANKVYDMKIYGVYNARHIVMSYDAEAHFTPLIPNDYLASEFYMPRPTLEKT
ncbi:hypothetical protein QBC43DRAFT_221677, partial [Cladorrhinum sp. PSN259]